MDYYPRHTTITRQKNFGFQCGHASNKLKLMRAPFILLAAGLLAGCVAPKPQSPASQVKHPTTEEIEQREAEAKEAVVQAYRRAYEAARLEALRGDDANMTKRSADERRAMEWTLGAGNSGSFAARQVGAINEAKAQGVKDGRLEGVRQRKERFLKENPTISVQHREMVERGSFVIGMSAAAVRAAFGEPRELSRTVNASGTSEHWSYGSGSIFLHFQNGVLQSFQETR